MKIEIERSVNDKGEAVITFTVPIPASVDPKDYDVIAALVQRNVNREIMRGDWLKLETKS